MRLAAFSAVCVVLLTLTGCAGAFDPLQRPGNWTEEGSADETIAQQAANPADLINGQSEPTSAGAVASGALDKITIISSSSSSSGGSGGGSSSGSGGGSSSGSGSK